MRPCPFAHGNPLPLRSPETKTVTVDSTPMDEFNFVTVVYCPVCGAQGPKVAGTDRVAEWRAWDLWNRRL